MLFPRLTFRRSSKPHQKDALPKGTQETLLNELKEIFLPYWSNNLENIVMVPATDAAELNLRMIRRWSREANSVKAAGAANVRLIEKLQAPV